MRALAVPIATGFTIIHQPTRTTQARSARISPSMSCLP